MSQSPREAYSKSQEIRFQEGLNMMMQLDRNAMSNIREEFVSRNLAVDLYDFCQIMQNHLNKKKLSHVRDQTEGLFEIFKEVDVNGDAMMSWEEFTSYLVELAIIYTGKGTESHQTYYSSDYWDTATHLFPINYIKYFPHMDKLIVFERGNHIFKVHNADLSLVKHVRGHTAPLLGMTHLKELGLFCTSSADRKINFWSTTDNFFSLQFQWILREPQLVLDWNGMLLFSGTTYGDIYGWRPSINSKSTVLKGHSDAVMDILTLNSNQIASGSLDALIKIWDCEKSSCLYNFDCQHKKGILSLSHSKTDDLLASCGLDSFCAIWSINTGKPITTVKAMTPDTYLIGSEFVPNSNELLICDSQGQFQLYDLRNFSCIQTFFKSKQQHEMSSMVVLPNAAVICGGRSLYRFDKRKAPVGYRTEPIRLAKFNSQSLTFLVVFGRHVQIWNALTGAFFREFICGEEDSEITAVCLDDRQRRFFVGEHDGLINCYNYNNGAFMTSLTSHSKEVSSLQYVDQRKEIISCSWDGIINVHRDRMDASRCSVKKSIRRHKSDIVCSAINNILGIIACADADGIIFLHDLSMVPIGGKMSQECSVTAICFLGSLPILVTADDKGGIYMWITNKISGGSKVLYWKNELVFLRGSHDSGLGMITGEREYAAVTCLGYDPNKQILVAGDETGILKGWLLKDILPIIQTISIEEKVLYGTSAGFQAKIKKPNPSFVIRAHNDLISGIEVINTFCDGEHIYMSWGYDGNVNFFNSSGYSIGSLHSGRSWRLRFDVESRKAQWGVDVTHIKETLNQRQKDQDYALDDFFLTALPSFQRNYSLSTPQQLATPSTPVSNLPRPRRLRNSSRSPMPNKDERNFQVNERKSRPCSRGIDIRPKTAPCITSHKSKSKHFEEQNLFEIHGESIQLFNRPGTSSYLNKEQLKAFHCTNRLIEDAKKLL